MYQRWDQVSRRSKHPYKHGSLDIPEVGSGALEYVPEVGSGDQTNTDHWVYRR
jgi:hypothetical protein